MFETQIEQKAVVFEWGVVAGKVLVRFNISLIIYIK